MAQLSSTRKLNVRSILRHYGPHIRRFRVLHLVTILLGLSAALLSNVTLPLFYKRITDIVAKGPEGYTQALFILASIALVVLIYNILYRANDYVMIRIQSRTLKSLMDSAHRELQEKSYEFFVNTFAGSLIAKTRRYVGAFETLHDEFIFRVVMNGSVLVATVVVLFLESPLLGAVTLTWLTLHLAMVAILVRWQIPKSLENAASDSATTARYSDSISNILTVKMFGNRAREQTAFEEVTTAQEHARHAAWMRQNFWGNLCQAAAVGLFEICILFAVLYLWKEGKASAGTIVLVQVFVLNAVSIVWQIGRNVVRIFTALTDAQEMVDILDAPRGVHDVPRPETIQFSEGGIVFERVTHQYNGASTSVFKDLSLTIPPGQRVALVGHSGAGKTTIVKLLLRFVDVSSGRILIDGQNIAHVQQDELRKHIAYVPQEPLLFHRSLCENIAYGRPNASLEDVAVAAKRAHAHDFIERLPLGYDTLVGERGIKLSGGERQRVAIARAMLTDAPIVILDEATSSLDSVSEKHIQAGFDALMQGRTTLVIAHRLSTIQHMDRIIVLEHGAVIEDGSHVELLAKNGTYAELWHSQVGGFIQE